MIWVTPLCNGLNTFPSLRVPVDDAVESLFDDDEGEEDAVISQVRFNFPFQNTLSHTSS